LIEFLQKRELLLILDNCEHLVKACAELVTALLLACTELQVMASSREPLGVPGEQIYEVLPLSLPQTNRSYDPGSLEGVEAVQLFIERARAFQPEFKLDDQTATPVTQICLLLDGIPLAVELAAARARVLSSAQIGELLKDNMALLASGTRSVISRQQTLLASIDWSYTLLCVREQILFHRLAIFAGEFLLEDVEAVCTGPYTPVPKEDETSDSQEIGTSDYDMVAGTVLETLSNLVDKSLVRATPGREAIYRLLNPIQRYAWVKLGESGERTLLRNQHLEYYRSLAKRVHPIRKCAKLSTCLKRLDLEIDNFRSALDWALRCEALDSGLHLACNLGEYWWRHGSSSEGLEWITRFLDNYQDEDINRANALLHAGRLAREGGDYERANILCEDGLRIYQMLSHQAGIAEALSQLGANANYVGNLEEAIGLLTKGLDLYRKLGDEWNIASKLLYIADTYRLYGENQLSTESFLESLDLFKRLHDKWGTAWVFGGLGDQARIRGYYREALVLFREAFSLHIELVDLWDITFSLAARSLTLSKLGQYREAAIFWGYTEALRESIHAYMPPAYREDYASYIEGTRDAIGKDAFDEAWAEGRSLTLEQVTAMVMQPLPDDLDVSSVIDTMRGPLTKRPTAAERFELTEREIEVLGLVAQGLTDAQVADRLYISPRTVSKHLQSIYGKIQVNTRSAATRFAIENDLV